jgi:hypothetical protein
MVNNTTNDVLAYDKVNNCIHYNSPTNKTIYSVPDWKTTSQNDGVMHIINSMLRKLDVILISINKYDIKIESLKECNTLINSELCRLSILEDKVIVYVTEKISVFEDTSQFKKLNKQISNMSQLDQSRKISSLFMNIYKNDDDLKNKETFQYIIKYIELLYNKPK